MFAAAGQRQPREHILDEHEIVDGIDELGVLLYGHAKGPIGTARNCRSRKPAISRPIENATGLQVTSAALAGMVWALENPLAGIVEADGVDYRRCLEVQLPLSGPGRRRLYRLDAARQWPGFFPEDIDLETPGSSKYSGALNGAFRGAQKTIRRGAREALPGARGCAKMRAIYALAACLRGTPPCPAARSVRPN